jgi:hypothetical protein
VNPEDTRSGIPVGAVILSIRLKPGAKTLKVTISRGNCSGIYLMRGRLSSGNREIASHRQSRFVGACSKPALLQSPPKAGGSRTAPLHIRSA